METTQKLNRPLYVKKIENGGLKNVDILFKIVT